MEHHARKSSTGQEQRRAIAASNRSGLIWPFSKSNQTRLPGSLPGKSPRPRRHPCRSHPGAIDELANVTPDYKNCLATVKLHLSGGDIDGHRSTAARTRVLIDSTDGTREWSTVGISGNIIDASWRALVDSNGYNLMKA